MRVPILLVAIPSLLLVHACGAGPGEPASTLSLTVDTPVDVQVGSTFELTGQVEGAAPLDSVVLTYPGARRKSTEHVFSWTLTAATPGTVEASVVAFSSETEPASRTVVHTVAAKSLTLTLAQPSSAEAMQSFIVSGEVAGEARLDSVVVTYQGQRRYVATRSFSTSFTATRAGTAEIEATAYSREAAAPVRQVQSHEVLFVPVPPVVEGIFAGLPQHIAMERESLQQSLSRNPQAATAIQAKIDLLATAGLADDVVTYRRYRDTTVVSVDGREIPVAIVFPTEAMRAEAADAIAIVRDAVSTLEGFMATPFPVASVRIWYGFTVGNRGGGGGLWVEDRGSYQGRQTSTMLRYEMVFPHEVGHTYIGSEPVNQFLELYAHNVNAGRTPDVARWTDARGYVPGVSTNAGVHAVLDIYRLIGHDAMSRAYRQLHLLRPPYGQALSVEARQAFVNEAPDAAKDQVRELAARIGL